MLSLPIEYSVNILKPVVSLILLSWGLYIVIKSRIKLFGITQQGVLARILGCIIVFIALGLFYVSYNWRLGMQTTGRWALTDWFNILVILITIIALKKGAAIGNKSHQWHDVAIIALSIIVAGMAGLVLYNGVVDYAENYRNRATFFQDSVQCIFPIIVASIPGSLFVLLMMIGQRERRLSIGIGVIGGILSGALAGSYPLFRFIRFNYQEDSLFVLPYFAIGLCAVISGLTALILSSVSGGKRNALIEEESARAKDEARYNQMNEIERLAEYKETIEKLKRQKKG